MVKSVKFRLRWFLIPFSIILIIAGIYLLFFSTKGYKETTATIVEIKEIEGTTSDETEHEVTVQYVAEGQQYEEVLDAYNPSYKIGKTIKVYYDPENPTKVKTSGTGFGIYAIIVGVVFLAVSIYNSLREKKAREAAQERKDMGYGYMPSESVPERELYFSTDRGTAKYGHRIEDKDRNILYEAKVTKFSLTSPTGFDFIDHVNGTTTAHLVGHEETNEWNSLILDDHSSFTFDGTDIWKHLKENGIKVDTSFMEGKVLWPEYTIYRDGRQIARAESSSMYVHEEEEAEKRDPNKVIPVRGYFRVWTTERNLDLLFVTLLAFARTEALHADGGVLAGFVNKN